MNTCQVSYSLGAEKAGAIVVARLGVSRGVSATETIIEHMTVSVADAQGQGSLALWSNAALNNGSRYRLAISHPSGSSQLDGGMVPNASSCLLSDVFVATTFNGAPAMFQGAQATFQGA